MNLHSEDSEVPDVLSAIGQVNQPASHVLENARDVLWSAIAEEMLSNAEAPAEFKADQPQRAVRQRRANNPQQAQQRRNAGPGA